MGFLPPAQCLSQQFDIGIQEGYTQFCEVILYPATLMHIYQVEEFSGGVGGTCKCSWHLEIKIS